jgi:Helix-turn-helix domain
MVDHAEWRKAKTVNSAEVGQRYWDAVSYRRIESARYDEEESILTVRFADGTVAAFDPTPLLPSDLSDVDWWRVASNEIEIIVPHADGWFEIPWDVVRRHTDPAYAAFWARLTLDHARQTGERLQALRLRRGLSISELAQLARLPAAELARVERGDPPPSLSELEAVLTAMGFTFTDLASERVVGTERSGTTLAG